MTNNDSMRPMLFEGAISEAEAVSLLCNDAFWMEQKADGARAIITVGNGAVIGKSRQGLPYSISREAAASLLLATATQYVLDAEVVNGDVFAFDLLALNGTDLRDRALSERRYHLEQLFPEKLPRVCLIQTCKDAYAKEAAYQILRDGGAEGVVFKMASSVYRAGRCGVNGPWRRRKWTASATLRVKAHHATKHSVHVETADGVELSTVTIPQAKKLPPVGSLVEVHYLYAHRNGGISQPAFKGIRTDKSAADAVGSLQFKGEGR